VLDSCFNLTNNSYLIYRLSYDLIRFFDRLVVAYFFGPPCIQCSVWRNAKWARRKSISQREL